MNDILATVEDFLLQFLPPEILGISLMAFIGLVIGIFIACYEGLGTKFKQYKVKIGDKTVKFDKRYLASGVMAIVITFITIFLVSDSEMMNGTESFVTAITIGFTEGMVTIKALNRRIDLFIARSGAKLGASKEQTEEVAKMVEVIDETPTAPVITKEQQEQIEASSFTEVQLPEDRVDKPVADLKFKTL